MGAFIKTGIVAFFFVSASITACFRPQPEPQQEAPVETDAQALSRANDAAMALGGTLKGRLQAELPKGPAAAATVCAEEAQDIGAKVAKEKNAAVGRASLRTRNERNVAPDWVRVWLEANADASAGEASGFSRVDDVQGRRMARVLKPIPVEPSCVACHGAREHLAPEVASILADRYPSDEAVGYEVGDLRGALWAEVEVGAR